MLVVKNFKNFLLEIFKKRRLIISLTISDFKKKYSSSYLGLFWSFIQPLINIGVFWFVFSIGFKTSNVQEGIPFILWLACGLIPWYYFSEVFSSGSNVFFEYSYMLRQMVFNPSILPLIKILSAMITHIFFIFIIILISVSYNIKLTLFSFQIIYYILCMVYLLIGLSWIFSSIKVFLTDTGEVINIILQFGFWLTPIFWNIKMIPEKYHWIFKLNPMYYVINGFRDSFINKIWFWEYYRWGLEFWFFSTMIFILGGIIFRKLKPHFNDVL